MSKVHVMLLKRAATLICNKEKHFICDALRDQKMNAFNSHLPWSPKAHEIKIQIDRDLDGYSSLAAWLHNKHKWEYPIEIENDESRDYEAEYDMLRPTRLAWIDALILYWKDKP